MERRARRDLLRGFVGEVRFRSRSINEPAGCLLLRYESFLSGTFVRDLSEDELLSAEFDRPGYVEALTTNGFL